MNIEIKEENMEGVEGIIPIGAGERMGKENVLVMAVPIVEKPTITEKAKVIYENATDKTRVELHNAKEVVKSTVLNAGEAIRENILHMGDKVESLKTKLEHAIEDVLDLN
jgi:hypothetical protein